MPTIESLLEQLATALSQGDSAKAQELVRLIQQRLIQEHRHLDDIELRLRALLAEATRSTPADETVADIFSVERSLVEESRVTRIDARGTVCPVWFGTNRRRAGAGSSPGSTLRFGAERSNQITLGRVDVWVPRAHRFGETGSSLWTRLKRFDLRDDRLRIQRVEQRSTADFWIDLQAEMREAEAAEAAPHGLVFLHGYNNSFEDAAIRAAQIDRDLNVSGATAFFSWPSRGTLAGYPADEASIEASEGAITQFLVDFAARSGAAKVHVIAHSMGNRGLLRALQRIAANAETRSAVRFGQIFLAAPDVDRDLFLELAHLYPSCSERTTLYASDADLAVHLSSRFHAAPRAGYFRPYTVAPGIDTIAVPDFDIDQLGHAYFAQAEALLHDIFDLIRHGEPPNARQRLRRAQDAESVWEVIR